MSTPETLRTFIPHGYCVPGEPNLSLSGSGQPAHEVFTAIDNGQGSERLFIVAESVCLACVQIEYCRDQRDAIGSALWRAGVSTTVAGGQQVDVGQEPAVKNELDGPAFRFDLSILPPEPDLGLKFLRQGIRAHQLRLNGRRPTNAPVIAKQYGDLLGQYHPETATMVTDTLTDKEREQAFRYIIMSVCQQADFRRLATDYRSTKPGAFNPRYNPETHDYERYYPIVELYLRETVDTKEMRFQNPGQMSMHFSAEHSRYLLERFGPAFIQPPHAWPIAKFYELVRGNIRDPHGALTAFLAREQSHRVSGSRSAWITRRRATSNRPPADDPAELEKRAQLLETYGHLGVDAVDKAINQHENAGARLATIDANLARLTELYGTSHSLVTPAVMKCFAGRRQCEDAVLVFIDQVKKLTDLYGEDKDVGTHNITWFARQYGANSSNAVAAYKKRLERFREWATVPGVYTVSDSYLKERARQGEVETFEDLAKAYIVKLLKARIASRSEYRTGDKLHIEPWVFNRLAALYEVNEMEKAGEGLITLIAHGVLTTTGIAELHDLQDPIISLDVENMADPRTRKYLSFTAELEALTARQRFALARDYNLTRLLYGRPFTPEQLAGFLGPSMPHNYGRIQVEPLCRKLLKKEKGAPPVPFSVIQHDVVALLRSDQTVRVSRAARSSEIVTVVGADFVQLMQDSFEENFNGALSDKQTRWLQHQINTHYAPVDRPQYVQEVANAIRAGRLVVKDNGSSGYRLSLGEDFLDDRLDQVDRALIAQVMGAANLLYGQDLSLTLRYRLGTSDVVGHMLNAVLPKLPTWKNISTSLAELHATSTALMRLVSPLQASQLWHVHQKLVAISADGITRLRQRGYGERPSAAWESSQNFIQLANRHQKNLPEIVKGLQIEATEQIICKTPGSGRLDVFYSPRATEAIRSQVEA